MSKVAPTAAFTVEWPCHFSVSDVSVDQALSGIVLRPGEFGRGRDLPQDRLAEIDAACAQYKMSRHQALSLRRQLLRAQPNGMQKVNYSPAMGDAQGQREYANLFERAVEKYLQVQGVPFLSQQKQLIINKAAKHNLPTPDILFTRYKNVVNDRESVY
jgi:hypothetical protein